MTVHICNIRDLSNYPNAHKYAIVRSLRSPINGVKQLDALSPSKDLFFAYLDMKKQGLWSDEAFRTIYTPRFLEEMRAERPQALLRSIAAKSHEHEIALACFCTDFNQCHRSIIYQLLVPLGAKIGDVK